MNRKARRITRTRLRAQRNVIVERSLFTNMTTDDLPRGRCVSCREVKPITPDDPAYMLGQDIPFVCRECKTKDREYAEDSTP